VILLILVGLEVRVLAVLAFFPYLPDPGILSLNMEFYWFLVPLSTVFLLGLLYAWLINLGSREARRYSPRIDNFVRFLAEPFQHLMSPLRASSASDSARVPRILSSSKLMLGISLGASVVLGFVPYRPDINPSGNLRYRWRSSLDRLGAAIPVDKLELFMQFIPTLSLSLVVLSIGGVGWWKWRNRRQDSES